MQRRRSKIKRQYGCEEPVASHLSFVREIVAAIFPSTRPKGDYLDNVILSRFDQHGNTHKLKGFLVDTLWTAEPENAKAMLSQNFAEWNTRPYFRNSWSPLLGSSIAATEGQEWKSRRAAVAPIFRSPQVAKISSLESHIVNLFASLDDDENESGTKPVNAWEIFGRFSMDSNTELLLGETLNTQLQAHRTRSSDQILPDLSLADALNLAARGCNQRMSAERLSFLVNPPNFWDACKSLRLWTLPFVNSAVRKKTKPQTSALKTTIASGDPRFVVLDALVTHIEDPSILVNECLELLVAGHENPAALLSFAFILLARHPHVLQHLRSDVLDQFGREESLRKDSTRDYLKLPYLQWVLYEALRLYPTAPLNHRVATKDMILPKGGGPNGDCPILVPQGQTVSICVYQLHRRIDLWGDDAAIFRPERWDGLRPGWAFIPFGGGPRKCIGSKCKGLCRHKIFKYMC